MFRAFSVDYNTNNSIWFHVIVPFINKIATQLKWSIKKFAKAVIV